MKVHTQTKKRRVGIVPVYIMYGELVTWDHWISWNVFLIAMSKVEDVMINSNDEMKKMWVSLASILLRLSATSLSLTQSG